MLVSYDGKTRNSEEKGEAYRAIPISFWSRLKNLISKVTKLTQSSVVRCQYYQVRLETV